MNLTQKIAAYIGSFSHNPINPMIEKQAKQHFIDTFACIVCGSAEPSALWIRNYIAGMSASHGSRILFDENLQVNPAAAALYYGFCAHNCDADDLSKNLAGHPSAVVLPVILALGTMRDSSGIQCLRAYIAGVETASAIGKGFLGGCFSTGWNQTTVLGIFGAVAAASVLMGLSEEEIVAALGIAASEASGLKVNYGSSAKDVSVGNASAKAIFAAELAKDGIRANPDSLGAASGLFRTLAPSANLDAINDALTHGDSDFLYPGIILKPYPACRGIHNGIDGALALRAQYAISPEEIQTVTCLVQDTVIESNRYPIPNKPTEAKFSLGYCIALALLHGAVTAADFSDSVSLEPAALKLAERVKIQVDNAFTSDNAKSGIEVIILTRGGQEFRHRGQFAKGDPNNPMMPEEHRTKLIQCLSRRMSIEYIDALLDRMTTLEKTTICKIYDLCNSCAPAQTIEMQEL